MCPLLSMCISVSDEETNFTLMCYVKQYEWNIEEIGGCDEKHKAYRVKVIARNSCLIALLLVMAIIFIMSNQSAKDSYKVTGSVVSVISKEPISQSDWEARSVVVTAMRKLAHITLFALLGF